MHDRILDHHPLVAALSSAIARVTEIPAAGWLWGLLASAASAAGHDVFTGIFLAAGVFTLCDLRWGALVAQHEGRYDADRKRRGRDAKIITLALLLGLRGVEFWAASWGLLDVPALLAWLGLSGLAAKATAVGGGIISALICTGVWYDEAQSWELHRRTLGGRAIPIWSAVLTLGKAANARILAVAKAGAAQIRSEDGSLR